MVMTCDEFNPLTRINGFLLNFNLEGPTVPGTTVNTDGDDKIFGDLGNDWLVGGTGRDNIYGGWGDDGALRDLWEWDGAWARVPECTPEP